MFRNFRIPSQCMRIPILRECSHLGRNLSSVERHNLVKHDCVCDSMLDMEECTELMCHRVTDSKESVCKRHSCHRGGMSHLLPGFRITCAIVPGTWEILEDDIESLKRQTISEICSHHPNISLHSMRNSIYS